MDLRKLDLRARERGHYQLSAAIRCGLGADSSLDERINIIGAAHEVGLLRNSLAPLWREWRTDADTWVSRCLERLLATDYDYWAVAGLLGVSADAALGQLVSHGCSEFALRSRQRYDQPDVHIGSFFHSRSGSVMSPVVEIGWDSESREVVEAARYRAVLVTSASEGANGLAASCSYMLRACLPYGSWREVDGDFSIAAESLLKPLRLPFQRS